MHSLRTCLKDPIPEIGEAAGLIRAAVDAHGAKDFKKAADLFAASNMPIIREWSESIWGRGWKKLIRPKIIQNAPPYLPKELRIPCRMPDRNGEAKIIARDGYHCRFCGIPVIPKRVREKACTLYPDSVTWGSTNLSQHAAFQAMWLQFDHFLPHSRGGTNGHENILITCAPCNYGRFHYTIEELGLSNPFHRPPIRSKWNGLVDFLE